MLAPEGMNSIAFGGDKGKRGEVYCLFGRYLCHGILFTRSHIIQLRWSLHYADFFQVSLMIKMIPQAVTVHDTFIIILSQYIVFINACYTLYDAHLVARILRYS